jgi:uncharacterized protein with gpF-like domain
MVDISRPGPPPKDAIEFFDKKGLKPAFSYLDVWREEHNISFTVAKMMQADLLADVQAAVGRALAEGRTFEQFQKEF